MCPCLAPLLNTWAMEAEYIFCILTDTLGAKTKQKSRNAVCVCVVFICSYSVFVYYLKDTTKILLIILHAERQTDRRTKKHKPSDY